MLAILRTVRSVFLSRSSLLSLAFWLVTAPFVLFLFAEWPFILNVVRGDFPLPLFLRILPNMFGDLFLGNGLRQAAHLGSIVLLFSTYLTLLLHIFWKKRAFSLSSFSTGALGLVGISLGVSCISCGAIIGTLLFSAFGATASTYLFSLESTSFLVIGELFLIGSILLVVRAIQKLRI